MQPVNETFVRQQLTPQTNTVEVGRSRFRMDLKARALIEEGPEETRSYPIMHALGGKNIYYLLTSLERGRLQALPLAYDVVKREWFDAGGSMVRHFTDGTDDAPLQWRDP